MYKLLVSLVLFSVSIAAQQLPDPTKPPSGMMSAGIGPSKAKEQDSFAQVKLSAIFNNNGQWFAIINGKTLKKGQKIHGFTLMDVTQHGVLLANEREQRRFALHKKKLKKDASHVF